MINKPDSNKARLKRHRRVRSKISGTPQCPSSERFPLREAYLRTAD